MAEAAWINADAGVPSYTSQELRRIQAMHLFPGSSDRFGAREGVRPNGQNTVDVSGTTWIQRDLTAVVYPGLTSASGPYVAEKGEESGSFDPADGTNDRIDALDLQVRDDDEDASTFRDVRVVYVAGTPAVTPSEPPLTANAFRVGTFLVPAGGTPSPSVRTQAQWTVAAGGIVPLADGATLPTTGVYEGAYADQDEALLRRTGVGWSPVASPNSPTVLEFTSGSGSFLKGNFPWARKLKVRVQGGGGGGGGTAATSAGEAAAAAGGGGGGYAESTIDISALASSVTVTVGAGGSGGSPGKNNGSAGGDSTFGTHVTGGGGGGGQGGTNTGGLNVTDGGDGGTGTINTGVGFVRPGGAGHNGSHDQGTVGNPGHGGEAMMGPGGRPSGTNVGGAGTPGGARGGGGSGAFAAPRKINFGGGDGFAGNVVIEVY